MSMTPNWARQIYVSCPKPKPSQGEMLWRNLESWRKGAGWDSDILMYEWGDQYDNDMLGNASCVFLILDYHPSLGYYMGRGCYKEWQRAISLKIPVVFYSPITLAYCFGGSIEIRELQQKSSHRVATVTYIDSELYSFRGVLQRISMTQRQVEQRIGRVERTATQTWVSEIGSDQDIEKEERNYYYLLV